MKPLADIIRIAAIQHNRPVTVFKFTNKQDADKAEERLELLNNKIPYGRKDNDISVDKNNEKDMDEFLKKTKLIYRVDEGVGVRAQLMPKHFDPSIQVTGKNPYGRHETLYYVESEHHKEPLQQLTGSKTLTGRHIEALKALGFLVYNKPEGHHL